MRTKILSLLAIGTLASAPAFAAEYQGWVIDGTLGAGHLTGNDIDDTEFGMNANIGYRWGVFGLEGGYNYFSRFKDTVHGPVNDFQVDVKPDGWTLGGNLNFDLNDQWSVMGRAGAFFWNADTHFDVGGVRVSDSNDRTDWYGGAALDYRFDRNASLGLAYTYYKLGGNVDTHIHLIGLRGEYRF